MSKIKLLLDVVSDMNALAKSIQAVADVMLENEPTDMKDQPEPIKEIDKKKASTAKEIKFEDIRGLLATKSQAGMTTQVRELIQKYGATKLSEIDSKHYASILKEAEELANE